MFSLAALPPSHQQGLLSRIVQTSSPSASACKSQENPFICDLKPSHLHPHHQSQLHCAVLMRYRENPKCYSQLGGCPSSPALVTSGMTHLCLCYQGQLYCAVQGRHKSHSPEGCNSEVHGLLSHSPDPRANSSNCCRWRGERRNLHCTPTTSQHVSGWDISPMFIPLRLAHLCCCH